MPSWQPTWTDVRFDHAKAQQAAGELSRCATLLDRQTEHRVALARAAQRAWRGRARDAFDDELDRMIRHAGWLVDSLRSLAARIGHASDEARLEQRRREDERARWWDEKRTEDALRDGQGLPPTPGPVRSGRPVRVF